MTAAEIIRQARSAGGHVAVDGADLVLTAPQPLPADLVDRIKVHKPALLAALTHPDPLPPLSDAAEARRQRVLAMLTEACPSAPLAGGTRYAALVEDPNTDPVRMAVAVRDKGMCEISIARERYDAFRILTLLKEWEREDTEPGPLWWRVAILEPGGRTVEVDAPSGMSLGDWQACSERHYAPGSTVAPLEKLPKPCPPVPLADIEAGEDSLVGGVPGA